MKFIIKLFVISLFVITLPFSISQAQNNEIAGPLHSGSQALQFQISDNFNLNSFSGSTISYKRQLSDVRAKRMGFTLNNSYNWRNFPDSNTNQKASNLDLNIGLDYSWVHYTNPESKIKFFYGYGPGIDLGFDKSIQESSNTKSTSQTTLYGVAGIGYAGVEWFFQSSMSLHAEYRASVQANHRREKITDELNGNERTHRQNSTSITFGGNGVKFGLSVYF